MDGEIPKKKREKRKGGGKGQLSELEEEGAKDEEQGEPENDEGYELMDNDDDGEIGQLWMLEEFEAQDPWIANDPWLTPENNRLYQHKPLPLPAAFTERPSLELHNHLFAEVPSQLPESICKDVVPDLSRSAPPQPPVPTDTTYHRTPGSRTKKWAE